MLFIKDWCFERGRFDREKKSLIVLKFKVVHVWFYVLDHISENY